MTPVKHVAPFALYALYVFVAGSLKDSGPPVGLSDKAAHFIGFGLMVPLAAFAAGYLAPRLSFVGRVAIAVAVSSGLGALLEVWQMFLPWRTAEFLDWVADTAGSLAVAGAALLLYRPSARADG